MSDSESSKKIESLTLENFTVFENTTFEFCPGINVLIGENSTGKTHVLKVLYSFLKASSEKERVSKTLLQVPEYDSEKHVNMLDTTAYLLKLSSIFKADLSLLPLECKFSLPRMITCSVMNYRF